MYNETPYNDFAYVYDALTDDVEYDKRSSYIDVIKKHFSGKPELLCDLGCGTGSICKLMDQKGYDCIGIDSSEAMLNVAFQKAPNILFLNQNICDFELYGTVDVFLSTLDTMNYVTQSEDVYKIFKLVNNYLNPGGIFIFDVNTLHKFENGLGNNTYFFDKDNIFYSWENFYEDNFLDFYLNFFVEENSGSYTRFTEHHTQKYHSREFLIKCAEDNSLSLEAVYGDMLFDIPSHEEERMFFVFKKQHNS